MPLASLTGCGTPEQLHLLSCKLATQKASHSRASSLAFARAGSRKSASTYPDDARSAKRDRKFIDGGGAGIARRA
jgi:hypothetical protein